MNFQLNKLYTYVIGTSALLLLFQNCDSGFQSAQLKNLASNLNGNGEQSNQCLLTKVQDLTGGGQLTLDGVIANQENDSHGASHAAHMGDSGKIGDHTALLDLFPRASSDNTNVALKGGKWSMAGHWSKGHVPKSGEDVYIPFGISMVYDLSSDAKINRLGVDGQLHFAVSKSTKVKVDTFITGPKSILTIGTEDNPVQAGKKAEVIFHRDRGAISKNGDPTLLGRGIITHGVVRITGQKKTPFLRVNANHHPKAGDSVLVIDGIPSGWKNGDKLVVGATLNVMRDGDLIESRDEVVTIKSIKAEGSTYKVHLLETLKFDHQPPKHTKAGLTLRVPVANFSRNIIFTTEKDGALFQGNGNTVPNSERGHVMFMHNADVRVLNSSFIELGRTDKSKFFSNSNVAGRYSLHFHRTGVIGKLGAPALAQGNAVWGSPGWGIVHHDANLDVIGNAVFGVFGSGIVAEAGNETGSWSENIVIQTFGKLGTFNAEQSAKADGTAPISHPAYQSEIENNSFTQGEAYGMKSRLLVITKNVAVSANGAGFSFWPHGKKGPSHIHAHSKSYEVLNGYDPFYGQSSIYPGKVPTRFFFGNEVIASRHALNTSANKEAHRHDMDVIIEDLLGWNVDQPVVSYYQENYIIKDCVFVKDKKNVIAGGGPGLKENRATHIHDPLDFKMVNNYWEGYDIITEEPMQLILGNVVKGSSITKQTGPDGLFREGATDDAETILLLDNSANWRNNSQIKNSIGHLFARVNLEQSTLFMTRDYSRFTIAVEKDDSFGRMVLKMGSTEGKAFRGASQRGWWQQNAANKGYYQQPNGDIYLITEAVVGDRITGTVGSIKVAIRLDFINNPATDFPFGGKNNGTLPSELDENGIGDFRIVDRREIGKIGNLLYPTPVPNLVGHIDDDMGDHAMDDHADHQDMGDHAMDDHADHQDMGDQAMDDHADHQDMGDQAMDDHADHQDMGDHAMDDHADHQDMGDQAMNDHGTNSGADGRDPASALDKDLDQGETNGVNCRQKL